MARQFFKDLPDTSTPLTASRLNGLLDGEETMGNLVVESIRSKNMFDKNSMIMNAALNVSDNSLQASSSFISIAMKCSANTTYTIQKLVSNRFAIGFTSDTNLNLPKTLTGVISVSPSTTQYTFTTPNNANYVIITISKITEETTDITNLLNSIQIELGDTATTYSPYQNLNNQESYSTGEIRIGTWVDGKPLYRRCVDISSITPSNTNIVNVLSWNIDNIIKIYGFIKESYNNVYPIPLYDSSTNYSVLFYNGTYLRGRASLGSGGTITNAYAIVEYTKTTD